MKALVALLTILGWAMTAVSAFLFGVICEHEERHHSEGTHMEVHRR